MPLADNAEVLENRPVGDDYWHLRLRSSVRHASAKPGQFFHLQCPSGSLGPSYLRRPMSVYGADETTNVVEFLYKVTGVGTAGLSTLVRGELLNMFGPLGQGFSLPSRGSHVLIVARGVGLATMGPLVGALVQNGNRVESICSFRSPESVVGISPFAAEGVTVTTVFDSDGSSSVESVAQHINDVAAQDNFERAYTCGSRRLARMIGSLDCLRSTETEVALEQRMACGLGMCHACVIDVWDPQSQGRADRTIASQQLELDSRESVENGGESVENGGQDCLGQRGVQRVDASLDAIIDSRRVCCEGPVFRLASVVSLTTGPPSSRGCSVVEVSCG